MMIMLVVMVLVLVLSRLLVILLAAAVAGRPGASPKKPTPNGKPNIAPAAPPIAQRAKLSYSIISWMLRKMSSYSKCRQRYRKQEEEVMLTSPKRESIRARNVCPKPIIKNFYRRGLKVSRGRTTKPSSLWGSHGEIYRCAE